MLRVKCDTKSDAFAEHGALQVALILRAVADRIESGQLDGKIRDINGNHCGEFDLRLERHQEVRDA